MHTYLLLHRTGLAAACMAGALALAPGTASAQEATQDTMRIMAPVVVTAAPDPVADAALPKGSERVLAKGQMRGLGMKDATIILEGTGAPEHAAQPVWPVQTRWAVNASDKDRSFVAELYGTASENAESHLTGIITAGYRKGAEVHVDAPLGLSHQATITIVESHRSSN
ncbi:MAG TPA: hypothetical protein VFW89_07255 [Gemmatimonadaceae bacterium]|nr:hypothetical protein [Gemmatimonadaceae bacterium]